MLHTTTASMDLGVATDGLVVELFCCCLMKDSFDKDYCVFMDNFYSSPALFQQLFQCNTVGTVRTGRKNMPADLKKPIARGSTVVGSSSKAADEPTASHWQALFELHTTE